jgi:hypothetical protein
MAFLLSASPAAAATSAGDDCVADAVEANRTMIPWNTGSSPLLVNRVVGEPGGVITSWKVRVAAGQSSLPQRLETYTVLNEKEEARKEAETGLETVGPGESSFPTRIPVARSAHLGLFGPSGTFACNTGEAVVTGTFEGNAALGEVRTITGLIGYRTPVTVTVEPDLDRDGYGDETQDGCPRSATLQTDCPPVAILHAAATARRRAILVEVRVSSQAQVGVFGQVRGGGPPVVLHSGGGRLIGADAVAIFRLPLGKAVSRRLGRLPTRAALQAKITVHATDLSGRGRDWRLTAKLPGRER